MNSDAVVPSASHILKSEKHKSNTKNEGVKYTQLSN
jgi:hypothetical protein